MWKEYFGIVFKDVPLLLATTTAKVEGGIAVTLFVLILFNRSLADKIVDEPGFSLWWSLVPIGLLLAHGLVVASFNRGRKVEAELNAQSPTIGHGGFVNRVFAIQKVEDMIPSGFWRHEGNGYQLICDASDAANSSEAKQAKTAGTLEYQAQVHTYVLPTLRIEGVALEVMGKPIPFSDWESGVYEGDDRITASFKITEDVPAGEHLVRLVAYHDHGQTYSEDEYLVNFP